jgi:hypothetical protein
MRAGLSVDIVSVQITHRAYVRRDRALRKTRQTAIAENGEIYSGYLLFGELRQYTSAATTDVVLSHQSLLDHLCRWRRRVTNVENP